MVASAGSAAQVNPTTAAAAAKALHFIGIYPASYGLHPYTHDVNVLVLSTTSQYIVGYREPLILVFRLAAGMTRNWISTTVSSIGGRANYSAVATLLNVVVSFVPTDPPHPYMKNAPTAQKFSDQRCKRTFATVSAMSRLMHCNMIGAKNRLTRRSLRNPIRCFLSGGCDSGGLPLPAPTKQTHCAEAGGEKRERGGKWRRSAEFGEGACGAANRFKTI